MSRVTETPPKWRRQSGFALLVTLLVLVLGAVTLYVSANMPATGETSASDPQNAEVLAEAREIVMARALADNNRPGSLPCASPDTDGKGTYNGDDCDADFGRFPYRTLDSTILRDADSEPLWYVLDPAFRDRETQQPFNPEEKPGALEIGDRGHFAAIIMAPRAPLEGQVDGTRDSPEEFFEAGNDTSSDFTRCHDLPNCNDRISSISTDELFDRVQERVIAAVAEQLNEFFDMSSPAPGSRYLPDALGFGGSDCADEGDPGYLPVTDEENGQGVCGEALERDEFPDWIVDNEWLRMIVYHVDPACTQAEKSCSDATLTLDGQRASAIVGAPGRPLTGGSFAQVRPGNSIDDYLDASENADEDLVYERKRLSRFQNDVIGGVGGEWQ